MNIQNNKTVSQIQILNTIRSKLLHPNTRVIIYCTQKVITTILSNIKCVSVYFWWRILTVYFWRMIILFHTHLMYLKIDSCQMGKNKSLRSVDLQKNVLSYYLMLTFWATWNLKKAKKLAEQVRQITCQISNLVNNFFSRWTPLTQNLFISHLLSRNDRS